MQVKKLPISKVLLVDDDEDDCMVFRMALEEVAPHVELQYKTSCENVADEIATLQPDLLFLDINLPRINGIEFLQQLQQNNTTPTVPIVMYSSSELPKDLKTSYEWGASLYFRKPCNLSSLIEQLTNILQLDWQTPEEIKKQFFYGEQRLKAS